MTRYIDADNIKWEEVEYSHGKRNETVVDCRIAVDNAPTIDAVEVVRCKDCRYFKKIAERSDSGLCHRDIVASAWKENGYCSRGERKQP